MSARWAGWDRALRERLAQAYERLNDRSRGWLALARATIEAFQADEGPLMAAAIAYYTFFSFFPLALFLIALGSFFLESAEAQARVLALLQQGLPASGDLIRRNIRQVLEARGAIGLVAALGFLWSASGVFSVINGALNKAWNVETSPPFWRGKLLGLGMVTFIGVTLFLLSLISTALFNVVRRLQLPLLGRQLLGGDRFWGVLTALLPLTFSFLMFLLLYKVVPYTRVGWGEVWRGALLAALAWEGAKGLFAWYLGSGLARYNLVYGSLEAVIALLLWSYITGTILLLGAEFCAQYAKAARKEGHRGH